MHFIGPVTVGGPDVKLYGTAKEIYEQILEINPAYNPDFPDDASVNPEVAVRDTLRANNVSFSSLLATASTSANNTDTDRVRHWHSRVQSN